MRHRAILGILAVALARSSCKRKEETLSLLGLIVIWYRVRTRSLGIEAQELLERP